MAKKRIEEIVTDLVLPVTEKHAFELVDVEFVKEGANWYLRVFIDKPAGIAIDDCQVVSEELSALLDKTDPIKQSYMLEVSSPGLDRPLKKDRDFEKYKGEEVEVKLFQPLNGSKIYTGDLQGLEQDSVVIKCSSGEIMKFERPLISTVKRVIKF